MIAIADSGSTKTDWFIGSSLKEGQRESTAGANPMFLDVGQIASTLQKLHSEQVEKVFFYGAGCSSELRCNTVHGGLKHVFPNAEIFVEHDLFGAARALCGDSPGIACILGTGSNTCVFDGNEILKNVPSLAFIIGDEGSGAHLGKALVKAVLYEELSPRLRNAIAEEFNITKEEVLTRTYAPGGNIYLASLSKAYTRFQGEPELDELAASVFAEFCARHLSKYHGYKSWPVHFVGSVATHFSTLIQQEVERIGFRFGLVVHKPIDKLIEYHLSKDAV